MATYSLRTKSKKSWLLYFLVVVLIAAISYCTIVNHLFVIINGNIVFSTVKSYSISGSDVSDNDLLDLKYLKNIEDLFIFAPEITNIEFVGEMKELNYFSVESSKIKSFKVISKCENLKILLLCNTKLTNLKDLKYNTELRVLDVYTGNPLNDISDLVYLVNLETLSISSTEITDISAISELENLTSLELSNTKISDISPISNCEKLKYLNLYGSKFLEDIQPLTVLNDLEEISLIETSISNYEPLLEMKSLKKVTLPEEQRDLPIVEKLVRKGISVKFI